MTLKELSQKLGCAFQGDVNLRIQGVKDTNRAILTGKFDNSYIYPVEDENILKKIPNIPVAVLCPEKLAEHFPNAILASKMRLALIKLLETFDPDKEETPAPESIHSEALIGKNVKIYPGAVVGKGAQIGDNSILRSNSVVEDHAVIGENCVIHSGAVVGRRCVLGNHVTMFANCVIGSDGFGYHDEDGKRYKMPQIGIVRIGNHVDIGACTTIDRAAIEETVVGDYTKIDNQVQVGHNCHIGKYVYIAGKASLSGSVVVEDGAILAGGCGIADHVTIGTKSVILAFTGIHENTEPGKTYFGIPARPVIQMHRINGIIDKLPELAKRIKALEKAAEKDHG